MDLLKKHYEKIILGGVLLILTVGAAFLPIQIGNERAELKEKEEKITTTPAKPLEPLNFSTQQVVMAQLNATAGLDLSSSHKVLNPFLWQKAADGRLVKIQTGEETGPKALIVTKPTPLYLTISLDGINVSEATPRYTINVERETAPVGKRGKKPYIATLNNKNDAFVLREVKGAPENPELVLELADGGEPVTISKDKPYKHVDGYAVDLKYPLESRPPWPGQRVGDKLTFGGENYIIVAITKTEVVVLAKSNQKKTPVPIPQ